MNLLPLHKFKAIITDNTMPLDADAMLIISFNYFTQSYVVLKKRYWHFDKMNQKWYVPIQNLKAKGSISMILN